MKNYRYSFLFLALVFALLINSDRIEKAIFPQETVKITKPHSPENYCYRVAEMEKELLALQVPDIETDLFKFYSPTRAATGGLSLAIKPNGQIDEEKLRDLLANQSKINMMRREWLRTEIQKCRTKP